MGKKKGKPRESYETLKSSDWDRIYFSARTAEINLKTHGAVGLTEENFTSSNAIWYMNDASSNGTFCVRYCRWDPCPKGNEPQFNVDVKDADDCYFDDRSHWLDNEKGITLTAKAIKKNIQSNNRHEREEAINVFNKLYPYHKRNSIMKEIRKMLEKRK